MSERVAFLGSTRARSQGEAAVAIPRSTWLLTARVWNGHPGSPEAGEERGVGAALQARKNGPNGVPGRG